MPTSAGTISSKGQITVPLKVRQRLGLKPGDKVEFVVEEGHTILRPARSDENPFTQFIGILPPLPNGITSLEWARSIRYGDEPNE